MKLRLLLWGCGLVFVVALTGCSQANASATSAESSVGGTDTGVVIDGTPTFEMPDVLQLMVGIFKLEDTDQAVTTDQAKDILPLWQAYRSLTNSDTAAQQEIDAVVNQLLESMTPDQNSAIAAMDITPQSMFEVAQELGIVPEGAAGSAQDGTQNGSQDGGFAFGGPPEGGFPEGGFSGDGGPRGDFGGGNFQGGGTAGGAGGFSGNLDPEAIATARAAREGGFANRGSSFLLDPLIELLQTRVGE